MVQRNGYYRIKLTIWRFVDPTSWGSLIIHKCVPGREACSIMTTMSDEWSQNSTSVVDPSIWAIHTTNSCYFSSQKVLSYSVLLLELTTMISAVIKRDWLQSCTRSALDHQRHFGFVEPLEQNCWRIWVSAVQNHPQVRKCFVLDPLGQCVRT